MLNFDTISALLLLHEEYRKSFVDDLEIDDKKYEVLCMLLEKEVKGEATYNLRRDNYFLSHVLEMDGRCQQEDDKINDIWKKSVTVLRGNAYGINPNNQMQLEFFANQSILDIGDRADINRKKAEFNKLKIQSMNKGRK